MLPHPDISVLNLYTEMFLGSKVRLVWGAENLTAIFEPIV
jgi:hypothetical protein